MKPCALVLIHILSFAAYSAGTNTEKVVSDSGYIAPHGGGEQPSSIPDRDAGCLAPGIEECVYTHDCGVKDFSSCKATTVRDLNTKELALSLRDEIYKKMGEYPYVVINNLQRNKMDGNRDKPESTFGEPIPEQAWEEFHHYIDTSKARIGRPGLFIDLHGHGHSNNWAELGYLIKKDNLNSGDFEASDTSIRSLASRVKITFDELLRGKRSFGGFIEDNEFVAVPAPGRRTPGANKYYRGGYNTRRHGSIDSGEFDAIQIESSTIQRSDEVRPQYAKALARSIKSYMDAYYGRNGGTRLFCPAYLTIISVVVFLLGV